MNADKILESGIEQLRDRASVRDQPSGERSMGLAVKVFNSLKGTQLSERDGWQFMEILKMARSEQGGLSIDDFIDGAAYAALAGESAARELPKDYEEDLPESITYQLPGKDFVAICTISGLVGGLLLWVLLKALGV